MRRGGPSDPPPATVLPVVAASFHSLTWLSPLPAAVLPVVPATVHSTTCCHWWSSVSFHTVTLFLASDTASSPPARPSAQTHHAMSASQYCVGDNALMQLVLELQLTERQPTMCCCPPTDVTAELQSPAAFVTKDSRGPQRCTSIWQPRFAPSESLEDAVSKP